MLEAINLTKKYGEHEMLTDLNPSVLLGEIFCLIDANGAGKTIAIILYIGFTRPCSEQVKAGKKCGGALSLITIFQIRPPYFKPVAKYCRAGVLANSIIGFIYFSYSKFQFYNS